MNPSVHHRLFVGETEPSTRGSVFLTSCLFGRYTPPVSTRLKRYRAFNERLKLTTPISAIKQGLYVKRPGLTAADQIVGHMEPSPTSQVCLVGGIGSGKSTELLLATERLGAVEDTRTFYIDVSELHDLENLEPGVLVTAVGHQLCNVLISLDLEMGRDLSRTLHSFREYAENREAEIPDPDYFGHQDSDEAYPTVRRVLSGKLSMPRRVDRDIERLLDFVTEFRASLPEPNRYVIVILDALDRVSDMEAFASAIDADLRLLQRAGIGVVLTAPLITIYGKYRPLLDRFDHIIHLPPVDPSNADAREFLASVLAARDPEGVIPDNIRSLIGNWSGGILRDMLALAKDAAQQAYMAGADFVGEGHVDAAVFQLGRTRWLGLNGNEIKMLRRIVTTPAGQFAPSSDAELALLMTRRVLEYPQVGKAPRFVVHPVLLPLLEGVRERQS